MLQPQNIVTTLLQIRIYTLRAVHGFEGNIKTSTQTSNITMWSISWSVSAEGFNLMQFPIANINL